MLFSAENLKIFKSDGFFFAKLIRNAFFYSRKYMVYKLFDFVILSFSVKLMVSLNTFLSKQYYEINNKDKELANLFTR